jgi:hypothetical protein
MGQMVFLLGILSTFLVRSHTERIQSNAANLSAGLDWSTASVSDRTGRHTCRLLPKSSPDMAARVWDSVQSMYDLVTSVGLHTKEGK